MSAEDAMYRWRKMSPEERVATLADRRGRNLPWHWAEHRVSESGYYLFIAACYEHAPIIGLSSTRMAEFERELVETVSGVCDNIFAWIVLPNHYHFLARSPDLPALFAALRLLHGRTSHKWNGEELKRGRHVWHGVVETAMKSEGHFWASLNYVLNNAVRHGYVERWQDWPYSNAAQYLEDVGRDAAEHRWRSYPLLDYGKEWDPPEL